MSFEFCLHISLIHKNLTNLDSGTCTCLHKDKWIRQWHRLLQQQLRLIELFTERVSTLHQTYQDQNYVHPEMQNRVDVLSQNLTATRMWNRHFLSSSHIIHSLSPIWRNRCMTEKFGLYRESWVRQKSTVIRITFYQNIIGTITLLKQWKILNIFSVNSLDFLIFFLTV